MLFGRCGRFQLLDAMVGLFQRLVLHQHGLHQRISPVGSLAQPVNDQALGLRVARGFFERGEAIEQFGNQIAFLRCGMYGGPNGGTPDGDIWHGMAVATGDDVVVHGETFDVNDPAVRSRLAGQDQHHCRITCDGEVTYGLVEPYDTLCWEVSKAGVMGFSLLDPPA